VQAVKEITTPNAIQFDASEYMYFDKNVDYMNSGAIVSNFLSFLESLSNRYAYNSNLQQSCENDQEDLLHEIELGADKNAYDGYRIYNKIREVRNIRRTCKDENEILQPIVDYLKRNQQLFADLDKLHKVCNGKMVVLSKRKYLLRGNVVRQMGFNKPWKSNVTI
jgi:hypothetical protein